MSEDKFKRKFEQKYGRRTIRFHNIPEKIAKEPSSVLQQENNDVVDAVRKEYQDLPQFQPVSGLVGNIGGLLGQTCVVNMSKAEVRDTGVSPIHFNTKDCKKTSYQDRDCVMECFSRDYHAQRNPAASSGIGTDSPDSYEVDSLEKYPISEHHSLSFHEGEINEIPGRHKTPQFDYGVYGGGRASVLQLESAPSTLCVKGCNCSIHGADAEKMRTSAEQPRVNKTQLTWGDIAQSSNKTQNHGSECDAYTAHSDVIKPQTPGAQISGSLTSENMREINKSALRRMDLEKWLNDVEESRNEGGKISPSAIDSPDEEIGRPWCATHERDCQSSRRKMRAPLQESLQLLAKLQVISEDDLPLAQNSVHRGGRLSCLQTVRAPGSLCLGPGNCKGHGEFQMTSSQSNKTNTITAENSSEFLNDDRQLVTSRTERLAKGGRQSTLNLLRASSAMCIHGPSCRVHCQKTVEKFPCTPEKGFKAALHSEQTELRGASILGAVQSEEEDRAIIETTARQSEFVNTDIRENELRGASIFGDFCSVRDMNLRGASSFAEQPKRKFHSGRSCGDEANNFQINLEENRGASCFAPIDESVADTSSVTLSFAVESDTDSFFPDKNSRQKKKVVLSNTLHDNLEVKDAKKYQTVNGRISTANASEKKDVGLVQREHSKNFDQRILKVGKDTQIMSTLLNALRRDGEKRKQQQNIDQGSNHLTSDKEALVGNLKVSVLYKNGNSVTSLLYVSILGLEVTLNENVMPECDVYVKVCLLPKFSTWQRTRTVNITDSFVLRDHFVMSGVKAMDLKEAILRFIVVRLGEDDKPFAQVDVSLEELKSCHKFKRTYALRAPTDKRHRMMGLLKMNEN